MSVVVVSQPEPIVSVSEFQALLGVTGNAAFFQVLLNAAQQMIDGPSGTLGRAIGLQTLELREEAWGGHWMRERGRSDVLARDPGYYHPNWHMWTDRLPLHLPFPPTVSVTSINYLDQNGVSQSLDPSTYSVFIDGDRGRIEPVFGTVWPPAQLSTDSIRVRYQAGYVTPPAPLSMAVMLMAQNLYDGSRRDSTLKSETVFGVGSSTYDTSGATGKAITPVVESLIGSFRVPSL